MDEMMVIAEIHRGIRSGIKCRIQKGEFVMDYDELIDKAVTHIGNIQARDIFLVKDLFLGTEWKSLEKRDKLGFGRHFKKFVVDGKIPDIEYFGKAENNSA